MTYVISDIHGHLDLFKRLMAKIALSPNDQLYVCGDIIEKGDDSVKLLRLISSMPNVHCIRGNHEEAFLNYYYSQMQESDDCDAVLNRLGRYIQGDGHLLTWELVDYIEGLPYYIETDDFICAHAGVPLDNSGEIPPLETVPVQELLYNRKFKNPDVLPKNGKCVFFGHTATSAICGEDKIIAYKKNSNSDSLRSYYKIHLDTCTFTSGTLGCFCVDSCKAYYVSRATKDN
ncbi:MAG: serine/threonine protein phosphatase [Clostridia bacterium]|nr:serine/threonine protein phosphatase [Clostridia bacterium]